MHKRLLAILVAVVVFATCNVTTAYGLKKTNQKEIYTLKEQLQVIKTLLINTPEEDTKRAMRQAKNRIPVILSAIPPALFGIGSIFSWVLFFSFRDGIKTLLEKDIITAIILFIFFFPIFIVLAVMAECMLFASIFATIATALTIPIPILIHYLKKCSLRKQFFEQELKRLMKNWNKMSHKIPKKIRSYLKPFYNKYANLLDSAGSGAARNYIGQVASEILKKVQTLISNLEIETLTEGYL